MTGWAAPTTEPKERNAKPIEDVCEICDGEWSGRWHKDAINGVRDAIYEGGTLHVIRDGASYAYRCKCFAAKPGLPAVPHALWERFIKEGKEIRE